MYDAGKDTPGFDPAKPPTRDSFLTREQIQERFDLDRSGKAGPDFDFSAEHLLDIRRSIVDSTPVVERRYNYFDSKTNDFRFASEARIYGEHQESIVFDRIAEGQEIELNLHDPDPLKYPEVINFTIVEVRLVPFEKNPYEKNSFFVCYDADGNFISFDNHSFHIVREPLKMEKGNRAMLLDEIKAAESMTVEHKEYKYTARYGKKEDREFIFLQSEAADEDDPYDEVDDVLTVDIPLHINPHIKEKLFPKAVFSRSFEAKPQDDRAWRDVNLRQELNGLHWRHRPDNLAGALQRSGEV